MTKRAIALDGDIPEATPETDSYVTDAQAQEYWAGKFADFTQFRQFTADHSPFVTTVSSATFDPPSVTVTTTTDSPYTGTSITYTPQLQAVEPVYETTGPILFGGHVTIPAQTDDWQTW